MSEIIITCVVNRACAVAHVIQKMVQVRASSAALLPVLPWSTARVQMPYGVRDRTAQRFEERPPVAAEGYHGKHSISRGASY